MTGTSLPDVRLFLRLIVDPGWAPIAVALAFLVSVSSGFGDRYDYVFHAAGGASIAFFAWRCSLLAPALVQAVPAHRRAGFSFAVALTVAVVWEVAEFAADRLMGTRLQHGLAETLRDIAYGALGALAVSAYGAVLHRRNRE